MKHQFWKYFTSGEGSCATTSWLSMVSGPHERRKGTTSAGENFSGTAPLPWLPTSYSNSWTKKLSWGPPGFLNFSHSSLVVKNRGSNTCSFFLPFRRADHNPHFLSDLQKNQISIALYIFIFLPSTKLFMKNKKKKKDLQFGAQSYSCTPKQD